MELKNGFKTKEDYEFPRIINVCVFNGVCPCNCVHCPIGKTPKNERIAKFGNAKMEISTFKKIVSEIANFDHPILRIHSVGEPLLWKNLETAVDYANIKKVKTWIFTSLITKDYYQLVFLANNCSIIEVSVNSIDKADYQSTKGTDDFELVINNLKYLSNFIKKYSLNTRLLVSRVESTDKEYDQKFVEYWKNSGLVDDVFIRSYHNYNNILEDKENKETRNILPCQVHWARFNINSDGNAIVCFNELFKGKHINPHQILGDIKETSIQEIWQGEKINKIRTAQLSGNYDNLGFKICCLDCKYCQPLGTTRITSEYQLEQLQKEKDSDKIPEETNINWK